MDTKIKYGYLHGSGQFTDFDGSRTSVEWVDHLPEGEGDKPGWYVYCGLVAGWQECDNQAEAERVAVMSEEDAEHWSWIKCCEAQ